MRKKLGFLMHRYIPNEDVFLLFKKVVLPLATGGGLAPGHAVTADGVRIVDLLCLPLKPSINML